MYFYVREKQPLNFFWTLGRNKILFGLCYEVIRFAVCVTFTQAQPPMKFFTVALITN